jgi:hypothetical protein
MPTGSIAITLFLFAHCLLPFAFSAEPSLTSLFAVNYGGAMEATHYHVAVVMPLKQLGETSVSAKARFQMSDEAWERELLLAQNYRQAAYEFVIAGLENEGFPRHSTPEALAIEYRALLEDSAIVLVAGVKGSEGEPPRILGLVSSSYDYGEGTAGEKRLVGRAEGFSGFPRSVQREAFLDIDFRRSLSGVGADLAASLLLSTRKWVVGGPQAVMEVKTLEVDTDLGDQALALGMFPGQVRAAVFSLLHEVFSSHCTLFAPRLPGEGWSVVATPDEVECRLRYLEPKIVSVSQGDPSLRAALEMGIRRFALEPPKQPAAIVETVFAEVGGWDPIRQRDLSRERLALFRRNFGFDQRLYSGDDPDVSGMKIHIVGAGRSQFDSGAFLGRFGNESPSLPVRMKGKANPAKQPLFLLRKSPIDLSFLPDLRCDQALLEFDVGLLTKLRAGRR